MSGLKNSAVDTIWDAPFLISVHWANQFSFRLVPPLQPVSKTHSNHHCCQWQMLDSLPSLWVLVQHDANADMCDCPLPLHSTSDIPSAMSSKTGEQSFATCLGPAS